MGISFKTLSDPTEDNKKVCIRSPKAVLNFKLKISPGGLQLPRASAHAQLSKRGNYF